MLAGHVCTVVIARRYREHPGRTARWGGEKKRSREGKKRKDLLESKTKEHQNKRKEERKKERNVSTPVNTPHPHRKRLYSNTQTAPSRLLVDCQSAEKVKS